MSIPSINMLYRRIPFALCEKVDKMVQDMLDQGLIQHFQNSWASPIVLVAKQDGTTRLCVDYHKLNAVAKMDVFSLPGLVIYAYTTGRVKPITMQAHYRVVPQHISVILMFLGKFWQLYKLMYNQSKRGRRKP